MSTLIIGDDIKRLQRRHRSLTGLLELILRRLELKPAAYEAIERHYREKTNQLNGCPWLKRYDLDMRPQGSVSTKTTVAPLERKYSEVDVDLVLTVTPGLLPFTVAELHTRVGNRLRADYAGILYPIRFGWTLDYAESEKFHFDVVTARPITFCGESMAEATDTKNGTWKPTNPQGYANGFLRVAEELPYIDDKEHWNAISEEAVMANSRRVTIAPLPENTVLKLPLQRCVQFVKRFRDIWFSRKKRLKQRTPSIIITTLLWRAYERFVQGHSFSSMFAVFETMASRMIDTDVLRVASGINNKPFYSLSNPTVPGENLVERWNVPDRAYEAVEFFEWVKDFQSFMKALASTEGMHQLQPLLSESLGNADAEPIFREIGESINPQKRSAPLYHEAGIGLTTTAISSFSPAIRAHTFHGTTD